MGPIFIVDDVAITAELISHNLTVAGFKNTTAFTCPLEALSCARSCTPPSILISDYQMPEISGLELIKSIRSINPACTAFLVTAAPWELQSIPTDITLLHKGEPLFFKELVQSVANVHGITSEVHIPRIVAC